MKPSAALGTVVLLVAGLLGLVPTPASAADAAPVSVTWPEFTRFNPTVTDYEFTVADAGGSGHLFAWWEPVGQPPGTPNPPQWPIPHQGTATAESWGSGAGRIVVERCPTATYGEACVRAAESPALEAYTGIMLNAFEVVDRVVKPGQATASVIAWPALPERVTSWQIVDNPRTPTRTFASGTVTAAETVLQPDTSIVSFPFVVPTGIPSGQYYLLVSMSAETADFGHLGGTLDPFWPLEFYVDSEAPRLRAGKTSTLFYPARDGYLDDWWPQLSASEGTTGRLEVKDSRGVRVFLSAPQSVNEEGSSLSWDGRSSAGRLVPEGRYQARVTVSDSVGHTDTWTGSVQVSLKKKQWLTFKRTVSAAASRTGKPLVGKCSTLARRPRGALGFFSQTTCQGSPEQGVVATNHGLYLPESYEDRYQSLRITMKGAPASRARTNYLVMGYVSPRNGKLVDDKVFRRGSSHRLVRVDEADRLIFDRRKARPYVIWSNGLTAGSRYLVRSYTVEVRYQVFR